MDRRRREDEAARLRAEVPRLESLVLEIQETGPGGGLVDQRHIRRIVVEHAPALFDLPCVDRSCEDGGHDVTLEVMRRLREGAARFNGEHTCSGQRGGGQCGRVLRYMGVATYG
jgi:hypothetical protein